MFHPGGQAQVRAEFVDPFILGEPRRIGGDFEEQAAWLSKIDGVKINPIHHRADAVAEADKFLPPGTLLCVIRDAKGDVMH